MRQYNVLTGLFALLTLTLLNGCGNASDKALTPYKRGLTSAQTANNSNNSAVSGVQLDWCKNFSPLDGTNGIPATMLAGASLCKIKNSVSTVRIKVSANFPIGGRFCLVPMTGDGLFRESCFAINGQADVMLDTTAQTYGYGSVAIIAEGDMAAYRAFVNFQTTTSPPRGIVFMN